MVSLGYHLTNSLCFPDFCEKLTMQSRMWQVTTSGQLQELIAGMQNLHYGPI
jgi:hypothetical protein